MDGINILFRTGHPSVTPQHLAVVAALSSIHRKEKLPCLCLRVALVCEHMSFNRQFDAVVSAKITVFRWFPSKVCDLLHHGFLIRFTVAGTDCLLWNGASEPNHRGVGCLYNSTATIMIAQADTPCLEIGLIGFTAGKTVASSPSALGITSICH